MSSLGQFADAPLADAPRASARAVTSFARQVAAWTVMLGVLALLVVTMLVPRLAGATAYTILSSSMSPGMPPGTLVVVRPRPVSGIGIGDVVTYQLESGRPAVVTHRVVQVEVNARGEYLFTTQGDANDVADAQPVREVQIRGVRWYDVPYVGHVSRLISGSQRAVALVLVAGALLAYSGFMFAGAGRDRLRKRRAPGQPR
jgi:signal peptidase I